MISAIADRIADYQLWLPWSIIAAGIVVGLGIELLVLPALIERNASRSRPIYRFTLSTLRGVAILWCTIIAIDAALAFADVPARLAIVLGHALDVSLIVSVTLVSARIAVAVVQHWVFGLGTGHQSLTLFNNLTAVIVYALGLLVALQSLGISITPLLTALGVGGLAVALALQDTLANFFGGIHIIASRRLRSGDYVKLQSGETGSVVDITWRNTLVRDQSNSIIVVPNSKVTQTIFTNFDQPSSPYEFEVTFKVAYGSDLDEVERTCCEIARAIAVEVPECDPDIEPRVRFDAFEDTGIIVTLSMGSRTFEGQFPVRHELIKRIHRRLNCKDAEPKYPFEARRANAARPNAHASSRS